MKNIIISTVAAAITAGALAAAPPALAEPGVIQDPTEDPTEEVTEPGPFPFPFPLPVDFPRLMDEPTYGPRGVSHGVREVRSVHSAYSIPASNPTA